jgi:hypothetical protein
LFPQEKFYGEEAAIPATTSLWSSLVAPLTGEDQAPGGSGASDWSSVSFHVGTFLLAFLDD